MMRLLLAVVAAVVVAVMTYVALTLKSTTNTVVAYGTPDQVALFGIGLVLAAGILFLGRSRVDADAAGIRFRNIAIQHELPWAAVRSVEGLRALLAAAQAQEPKPPPLLYDPRE